MDEVTRAQLSAINRDFYERVADDFGATRDHPWPGWRRVLAELAPGTLRVLDVGCGNGRFATFLDRDWPGSFDYLGIDSNETLLSRARDTNGESASAAFQTCDVLSVEFQTEPPAGPFDLITLFGVMHHVPSFAARRALLAALTGQLAPGGIAAVTLWQFAASARFRNHRLDWAEYNRAADEPVDLRQLEPGDHLLRWGTKNAAVPRYCHFSDDEETERLADAILGSDHGLQIAGRFLADGRSGDLNDYLLLRRVSISDTAQ